MKMAIPFAIGGPGGTMTMEIDMFDFGIKPSIDLPDEDSVWDATDLSQAALEARAESDEP